MRSKYRSYGGGGLGFFAFQDIITGTAGFLIVIAVLLALDINIPKGVVAEEDPSSAKPQQLERTLAEIAKLKAQLERLQTAPVESAETLQRQIAELRELIASISAEQLKRSTRQVPDVVIDPSLLIEKQKHITALKEAEQKLAELKRTASEAASEVVSLEKTLRDAEQMLKQSISDENVIKLIPDNVDQTKKPVVILADEGRYEIHTLNGEAKQASSTPDLKNKLAAWPPSAHFLVIYYKPSSASGFENLNQEMRGLGYEIGYDLVTQATQLKF